jgi:hypothetical protein
MSLQLIVYPQSYEGQINSVSSSDPNEEFVADGANFNSLNAASLYSNNMAGTGQALSTWVIFLNNAPPTVLNTWYKARNTNGGTPTAPAEVASKLVLSMVGTTAGSMVYQRLSNLIPGLEYKIHTTITTDVSSGGRRVILNAWNGSTHLQTAQTVDQSVGIGPIVLSFIAQTTEDIVSIFLTPTGTSVTGSVTFDHVSVTLNQIDPNATITFLGDGQVICDLYEDEDIPLTLSIDDFKNVAEKVQSYSKAFKLPGTKRNNQIFGNIYEITRADDGITFNPYVKTKSILKQDGFVLFEGYLRLIDIQEKEGEISYNINLYSEVIALADTLKGSTFRNLDFSELDHAYNKTNIVDSWTGSVTYINAVSSASVRTAETVKYPFVDWSHQFVVGGSGTGTSATDDFPELTALEQAFRPFIQIKYLIQRIFNQSNFPFSYTSIFINEDEDFEKLYMDFNWGDTQSPMVFDEIGGLTLLVDDAVGATFSTVSWDELDDIPTNTGAELPSTMGYSGGVFTAVTTGVTYDIDFNFKFDANTLLTDPILSCEWVHVYTGGEDVYDQVVNQTIGGASYTYSGNFSATLNTGDTLFFRAKNTASGATALVIDSALSGLLYDTLINITTSAANTTNDSLLQTLRGETDQWEFLKGILTMFNLVTLPDKTNPNNIIIEPYTDVFINTTNSGTTTNLTLAERSIAHDWTDKIDVSEMKLTPLVELNKKTIFKFVEDDDDYIFNVYKNSVGGFLYGSLIYNASTSAQGLEVLLTGEKEIVPDPFAATVVKPLMSQFSDFITPAIYSYNSDDGTSEGFENAPRIMYNNGKKTLTSCTYYIPAQNGVASSNADEFLQFSHLTDIPTSISSPVVNTDTRDFHFGECQLIHPVGNATPQNLFSLYWQPYFAQLYNPDTRTMSLKVNLSPGDINELELYDTVFIKNREFRINKIDYKPNDLATVEFILIP